MLRTLNGLLQGVVVADLTTLTQQFDVTARLGAGDSWQMDLVPKDAAIASRFSSIARALRRCVGARSEAGREGWRP